MKFIPLAFASIGGIILFNINGGAHPLSHTLDGVHKPHFSTLSPGLGVLASIPAIFFAFDGFYTTSASFDKMKDPSKGSLAISIGLVTVSTIYILVSIGIYLATKNAGDYAGTIIGFIMMYNGAT
jgi:amino acid transporter